MTDTGLLTWLLLIPAAAAADLRVESEADRLPPVLARVGQHSPVLSLPPNTHTRFGATVLLGIILFVCLWPLLLSPLPNTHTTHPASLALTHNALRRLRKSSDNVPFTSALNLKDKWKGSDIIVLL